MSCILGMGVDLEDNSRMETLNEVSYRRFLEDYFTENEIKQGDKFTNISNSSIMSKFTTKEATMKAFGCELPWKEIEVLNNSRGKPEIFLSGTAKKISDDLGVKKIFASISNTIDQTMAVVILEG